VAPGPWLTAAFVIRTTVPSQRRTRAERRPDVAGSVPNRHRLRLASIVTGVVALLALVWLGSSWRHAQSAGRVPPPPAGAQSTAVGAHLHDRHAAAARDPTSIGAIGPLCLAYHADMFYDHATACYALAIEVGRGDWRWTYYRALIQSERGGGGTLVDSLREVTERAPRFGPAWLRLGEAEFKAGRYDQAADAWRRVTALEEPASTGGEPPHRAEVPLSAYAEFGLARVAMVQSDPARARDILERLTTSGSKDVVVVPKVIAWMAGTFM